MSVPRIQSVLRLHSASPRVCLFAVLLLGGLPAFGKGPEPPLRIPLASLGWQPPTANVLAAGAALTTVHFIDEQHLLVTFSVRRLMKRLAEDPPGDTDRTVEAVVVEIASGKVLARTFWRLHDAGQYLWGLGHGRFLLRIRDTLTTFVPLANLSTGDAFKEQPFLQSTRQIVAVLLSAERDLVTVETVELPPPLRPGDPEPVASSGPKRTQINFYRVLQPATPIEKVIVQSAGLAMAKGAVNISLTSAGYIEVLQESASRWLFDFDSYSGQYIELSPFDTSCRPQAVFVSASEFVAFGCRGTNDRLAIGGFNMRGEQMWQQNFTDAHAFPNFAFAPANGRFALSRNIVASGAGITVDFAPSNFTTQEIRVYQTYNGKQLLRVEAMPVQRIGQNYDLSPEGLQLAIVHNDTAEIYRLPALNHEDEAAVNAAKALAPADKKAAVNLASHVKPQSISASSTLASAKPQGVSAAKPSIVPPPEAQPALAAPAAPLTDAPSATEPRKPPTLYTLPTDKVNKPEKPQL